jgi:hypothetical protein
LFFLRIFVWTGETAFLQGFLRKRGGKWWFFDGGFVVECW